MGIGLNHPLENPLLTKTKGVATVECKNQEMLHAVFRDSVSCAKRGHTHSWRNRQANGCGRCMPCIYRRAALHAAALDDELYGVDVCAGDVDWRNRESDSADDFRACLSFLIRNPSQVTIAKMLIANGHLRPLDAMAHAATVQAAMNEIRNLLRDKAIPAVRAAANLR
jgi:hypothetical protein